MKYTVYTFLCAMLLFSCKSKIKEVVVDSVVIAPVDSNELLIQKFKPIIDGSWINYNYIKKIISTKSPLAAANSESEIKSMFIDTTRIEGDSLAVGIDYSNRSWESPILKFKPGKSPETIQLNNDELGYSIKKSDTVLLVSKSTKTHHKSIIPYIKVLTDKTDISIGDVLDHTINKVLLSGTYTTTDNMGKVNEVAFTDDGNISGITGLRSYWIETFLLGPSDNFDQILFNPLNKDKKIYAFKIKNDTLNLYQTYSNQDSTKLRIGKLLYTLVRKT